METTLITCGGHIRTARCQALSKRTKQQCEAPASRGKRVCRFHGGKSTGPTSIEGRKRCAAAKTIHGEDTRELREQSREKRREMKRLFNSLPWYATRK
jgi:hypothetical protein